MTTDAPFDEAAEPERLRRFVAELEADGFNRAGTWDWEGPTRRSLLEGGHTTSERLRVIIRPSWPYLPPLLHVPGINAWHADQEKLCIWQAEDNSQRWATLQGLYDRIDEWAAHARDGFGLVENARNPEIYWEEDAGTVAGLVDVDELLAGEPVDGQHGEFHFTEAVSADGRLSPVVVYDLRPGGFSAVTELPSPVPKQLPDGRAGHRAVGGRWFYRSSVPHPPRSFDELRSFLTEKQREWLDRDLRKRWIVMFGLFWHNRAGLVGTVLLATATPTTATGGHRPYQLVVLRPKGRKAMLLRAGPDAPELQGKSVSIIGVGAIGSHVADQLDRAGIGRIRMIDYDRLWPANLVRHAAPPGTPAGTLKTTAMKDHLGLYPWIEIDEPAEPSEGVVWTRDSIRRILESADLTIDATGHAGLAELMGRVAHSVNRPYISVALFRGGQVARIRRQAHSDDTPVVQRHHLDRYPEIPPLEEEAEYVGSEVGCLALVHNAPPVAVVHAAALATEVAIDHLTGRHDQPDEIIEVFRSGESPFEQLGRLRREDLPFTIDLSEKAERTLQEAAERALPNETGGVLLGCVVDERPVISEVVEISDPQATPNRYSIPEGRVDEAVSDARARDPRLGYLGDWHSHPSKAEPSPIDLTTMLERVQDSGIPNPILILVHPSVEGAGPSAFVTTGAGLRAAGVSTTGDLPTDELADAS